MSNGSTNPGQLVSQETRWIGIWIAFRNRSSGRILCRSNNYPIFKTEGVANPAPYFQDWLAHPNYDDYWKQWSIEADYSRIQVPALHTGAWYDIFLQGTLRNFKGFKSGAGTEFARNQQRLIVEIGGHAGSGQKIGDVDFGANAPYDATGVMLRWYDFLFKNINNGMEKEKPVRVFTMGTNEWRDFDAWPPPDAQTQKMFLHSAGKANGSDGAGSLSIAAPGANESPDSYVYDPANPVQTRGGPLCCAQDLLLPGPKDQTSVEQRHDVLIYSTEPLAQNIDVTGPVTLELYVKSSAVDTDFTAKLVDVHPDGYAQNLAEGILRMRYRESREKPGQNDARTNLQNHRGPCSHEQRVSRRPPTCDWKLRAAIIRASIAI